MKITKADYTYKTTTGMDFVFKFADGGVGSWDASGYFRKVGK